MKRITVLLVTLLFFSISYMTVFAETTDQKGVTITTTVPSVCVITFKGGDGTIIVNGLFVNEQERYPRKSVHKVVILPKKGKTIDKVLFGEEDVTSKIINGCLTTPPVLKDTVIEVVYKDEAKSVETSSDVSQKNDTSKTTSDNTSSNTTQKISNRNTVVTGDITLMLLISVSAMATLSGVLVFILSVPKKKRRKTN